MKIKSIHLKNIRSYEDQFVEIPEGSTLLAGDVGCGKSTILKAMEFALFGLKKGELEGTDLLRHGKNSGSVMLNLELDGRDVKIERNLRRSKGITQDASKLVIDNQPLDLMPVELKSKILELIGYSQNLLKGNKPLFRFTVYTPQEEMKKILADEEDRLDTLRDIFDIGKYGNIRDNARTFMTELRRMKAGLEGEIRAMEQDVARLDELRVSKADIQRQITAEKSRQKEAEDKVSYSKTRLDKLKKDFAEINAIRHDVTKKESDLFGRRKRNEQIRAEAAETRAKILDYSATLSQTAAQKSLAELKKELSEAEKRKEHLVSEKAVLFSDHKKLHRIFTAGVCETCGQKVHNPEEFGKNVTGMSARLDAINEDISKIESLQQRLKDDISAGEKNERYSHLIRDLEERESRLEKELETNERDVASLTSGLDMLKPKTLGFEKLQEDIGTLENEFYRLQKDKSEIERILSRYEQQLADAEKRIQETEAKKEKMGQARQRTEKISRMLGWFDPFIRLMETMEKHVMLSIQKEFNEYFQKWFSVLMGDQLSVKIDERFSPLIEQNGYQTEYQNLSGGEKTAVALAYRLALNKVINDVADTIKTKDLLVLDEPTDGFSADQLDRIRDVIAELGLGQIIIVSHEAKIDTYVDNVIRVYKENHVSRVAY